MSSSIIGAEGVHASRHAAGGADSLQGYFASNAAVRRNFAGGHPKPSKITTNPIFTVGAQGSTFSTIQWPWLVNVAQATGVVGPYGETYRIYYSTDHESTTARIGMLTADTVTGPWTDRGQVYQDTTSGNQCETPAAVWNTQAGLWYLYYHMVGVTGTNANETTLLATSTDGVSNWTRVGVVADIAANAYWTPSQAGTGYFRPFNVGGMWYAHSLLSGGNYARFGLWRSPDGKAWVLDDRPLGNSSDLVGAGNRVEWNSGTTLLWNAQLWWFGLISNFTSGGAARVTQYVAAPISADFRTLLAPPTQIFPATQAWETSPPDNRSGGSVIIDSDGSLVLAYSGGTVGFGIARQA